MTSEIRLGLKRALAVLAAGALCALAAAHAAETSAPTPNIVLIVADDLGYGDLGCYGATRLKTPNLDRLARRGLRFTQAYAPSSTCTPSRYALMTGEYGWRQPPRKTSILDGDAPLCVEPGRLTLPSLLKQAGYTTALIGKWHLGVGDGANQVDFNGEIKPGPLEVGFDRAFFISATLDRVPCVFIDNHRVVGLAPADPISVSYQHRVGNDPIGSEHPELLKQRADAQHSGTIINGISRIGYMSGGKAARWVDEDIAATLTREAVAFIKQNRQRPFFLYFALHEPHVPRAPATRFRGASRCGIRGDAIEESDWMVGEVLAELDRCKLADNTLVMVTSDNGPILFDGYYDGADEAVNGHQPAGPLRGWKYLVFEGGTRVPFIARWPGHIKPGITDQMLGLNDLLATCAALTSQKLPPGAGPDSLNLLPVLLGKMKGPLRTEIVEHGISGALALRQGDWKFIPATAQTEATGIGSGANPNDKRFAESRIPEPLLFNLKTDPGETRNLAKQMPKRTAAMSERLEAIRRQKAEGNETTGSEPAACCTVTVDASDQRGPISPLLMGFDTVYKYETDSLWADGKVEGALKALKCGLLRWPGGTVVSSYHWNDMQGAAIMDLEEYMGHIHAIGAEPLVGINVEESHKSGREEEGLNETRALIQHCVEKNYQVKYWYIDNELYLPNPQPRMTAEEYAQAINHYAAVLRAVDPRIEIVANWEVRWTAGWETILRIAGTNINIADFHLYYHGPKELSWDSWLHDTPMTMIKPKAGPDGGPGRIPFASMIQDFRAQAKARGRPWKLAALEWNMGKRLVGPMSPFQGALVEAEEFGQFINAGLDMACFWPMHITGANEYRVLLDHQIGELHPNFQMFKMYSDVLGQSVLGSQASLPEVRTVAARSNDGKTVTIYLLRKTGEAAPLEVTLDLKHFKPASARAKVFNAPALSSSQATTSDLAIKSLAPLKVVLPAHSFTEIILAQ